MTPARVLLALSFCAASTSGVQGQTPPPPAESAATVRWRLPRGSLVRLRVADSVVLTGPLAAPLAPDSESVALCDGPTARCAGSVAAGVRRVSLADVTGLSVRRNHAFTGLQFGVYSGMLVGLAMGGASGKNSEEGAFGMIAGMVVGSLVGSRVHRWVPLLPCTARCEDAAGPR
jgi:hypothetical protein